MNASFTVKLTLQYKPSLTVAISGSNWIFVAFFLRLDYEPLKWRLACEGYTYACHLSGAWRVRAICTHAT